MLLQAYITQHHYDIICLSETFLNSSIETDDDRILIDGYNLIRADHPSDSKRGGVCIYYKEHISLIKRDDICTSDNCLVTEIPLQGEKCFLTCIYHSPSQNHDELDDFCTKFDLLLIYSQDGGRILPTQQVKKSILSHHQFDINKILIKLPIS